MTPEQSEKLREKFPPEAIGQKPQPYTKDSPKGFCKECGQKHGLPAMHLDFVGHALVTDRLLKVDPEWTWEPMGFDERGVPALDGAGNLWIRLTVGGVTRPGVGDGPDAKQKISDALRNAAMRFGVALDLWSKQEMEHAAGAQAGEESGTESGFESRPSPAAPAPTLKAQVWEASKRKEPDLTDDERKAWIRGELAANYDGSHAVTMQKLLRQWAA